MICFRSSTRRGSYRSRTGTLKRLTSYCLPDAGAGKPACVQLRAELDTARRQVARTKVVSPIAGQVVKRLVNVGEQVDGTAAQSLLEVANLDRVELAANVPATVPPVAPEYAERIARELELRERE